MKKIPSKMPKRPQAHRIGDRAVKEFKQKSSDFWAITESENDYGWDLIITISESEEVKDDFFVQVKGSNSPDYINNQKYISVNLNGSTVNWLLSKPMPTMLCICDTSKKGKPVFYTWIQEDIKRIAKNNPKWEEQENLVFHILVSEELCEENYSQIETYVKEFYENLKISAAIGDILRPSFGYKGNTALSAYTQETEQHLLENIPTSMKETGIFDVSANKVHGSRLHVLSALDQKLFKEIKKSSEALKEMRSDKAREIISEIEEEIKLASHVIQARFHNNLGVLYLQSRSEEMALRAFRKANKLCPNDLKYQTNILMTEYILLTKSSDKTKEVLIGSNWHKKLNKIFSKDREFAGIVRLKAISIGKEINAQAAEDYIRAQKVWKEEPIAARCELADLYKDEGDWDNAIRVLKEVEQQAMGLDGLYWNLYGICMLQKALGGIGWHALKGIHGTGPSQLNINDLKKSEQCLIKSCKEFEQVGFPPLSSIPIINLVAVQRILGHAHDAEQYCRSFLRKYPNHAGVAGAIATCAIMKDDFSTATTYSKIAYEAQQDDSLAYRNYMLCLFLSDDADALIELILKRQKIGFSDSKEKSISLSLYATALNEIGRIDDAKKQINIMKTNPEMLDDAFVAEAAIARSNGMSRKEIKQIFIEALNSNPKSSILLTHYFDCLAPSEPDDSGELINIISLLANNRQLSPLEAYTLGICYMTLNNAEKALEIFGKGSERFPEESRFLYGQARALSLLGNDEEAYSVLKKYFDLGKKDYAVIKNLAIMAMETGRLNEAINLFQKAILKSQNADERGDLHNQLWELKRRRGDPSKEVIRHIIEYGKTTGNNPEKEARFLIMALLSPYGETDEEEKDWNNEIRRRIKNFSQNHPRFPVFTTFDIPSNLSSEELGNYIMAQIAAVMLPRQLATAPLEIATRSVPFPLVFRAHLLPSYGSTFSYWSHCISSKEFSSAIHIFGDFNSLAREIDYSSKTSTICIDLTALLTLAELNLLSLLKNRFSLVVITRGTKRSIEHQLFRAEPPHPLAVKIERWRQENRSIIRIRNIPESEGLDKNDPETYRDYVRDRSGIFLRKEPPVNILIGDGVGESLLLANQLNIPLYSDESYIRNLGYDNYRVKCLSTISLIRKLRNEKIISIHDETIIFCEMIRKNFRVVPFDKDHLNSSLEFLLTKMTKEKKLLPGKQALLDDENLGLLLKQFGDPFFNEAWLVKIAVSWWLSMIEENTINDNILTYCIEYPSYALSMRHTGYAIMKGFKKNEQENRLAHIFAYFLVQTCELVQPPIRKVWSYIKTCCEQIFSSNQKKYTTTLFEILPRWISSELNNNRTINNDVKLFRFFLISSSFPEGDRSQFDEIVKKYPPAFMS